MLKPGIVLDPAGSQDGAAARRFQPNWRHAEAALWLIVGLGLLLIRLYDLDRFTGYYPDGIRAEQLWLMARGYQPFAEIFSNQGPWALQVMYPGYVLFGESLFAVRSTIVVASLVGLACSAWVARQLAGPIGGLSALILLGLSPLYLQFSRLAVTEPLALAPAVLSLACALRFQQTSASRWLLLAGASLAASLLIKPITLGMAAPIGLAVLLGGGRWWRNLLVLALVTAGVGLGGVLLVGVEGVLRQIVEFRLASRDAEGWSMAANVQATRAVLAAEGTSLLGLAAVGGLLAAFQRQAWPLLAWLLGAAATVFVHAPLISKHFVIVVVPLATLAAYGTGRLLQLVGSRFRWLTLAAGLFLLGAYLTSVPPLMVANVRILRAETVHERDEARLWWGDAIDTLRRVSEDEEFVITDHTYLAWAANRRVPPGLVEASGTRVRAGSLTDQVVIGQTEQYRVRTVLLWADKLLGLRAYRAWLTEHYAPVRFWAAEGEGRPTDGRPILWLRADERLRADREMLRVGLGLAPTSLARGPWKLVSAGLDRASAEPGAPVSVTLEVESDGEFMQEGLVVLTLSDTSGRVVEDEQEPLLRASVRPRWLFWTGAVRVPPRASPGEYRVQAALRDIRGRAVGPHADVGTVLVESR